MLEGHGCSGAFSSLLLFSKVKKIKQLRDAHARRDIDIDIEVLDLPTIYKKSYPTPQ